MSAASSAQVLPQVAKPAEMFSDDECVQKLALLLEHRDTTKLDEIVALIARLAIPIE